MLQFIFPAIFPTPELKFLLYMKVNFKKVNNKCGEVALYLNIRRPGHTTDALMTCGINKMTLTH